MNNEVQERRTSTHLNNAIKHVDEEQLCAKVFMILAVTVQFGHRHEYMIIYNKVGRSDCSHCVWCRERTEDTVEETDTDDRSNSPESIPEQQIYVVEHATTSISLHKLWLRRLRLTIDCSIHNRFGTTIAHR